MPFFIMKVKTKKTLKKQCDIAWALAVRKTNNGLCEMCGKPAQNSHHIISRNNYSLRYDIRNGANLCINDHLFGRNSAHQNSLAFMEWFRSSRPDDYEYIKSKSNIIAHYSVLDYQNIYQKLKEVKCLLGNNTN